MKLHEKTLELNITHELLNLADPNYCHRWTFSRHYPLCMHMLGLKQSGGVYAVGMHTNMEGKATNMGGSSGVDVQLADSRSSYAVDIQFKRASTVKVLPKLMHLVKTGQEIIKYKIRDKQHEMLSELSKQMINGELKNVLYALPDATEMTDVTGNIGHLAFATTFLSVKELDLMARAKGIDLTNGTPHSIYKNKGKHKCEVHSTPFEASQADCTSDLIADLAEVRLRVHLRLLVNELSELKNSGYTHDIVSHYIAESCIETLFAFGLAMESRIELDASWTNESAFWTEMIRNHNRRFVDATPLSGNVRQRVLNLYESIDLRLLSENGEMPEATFKVLNKLPERSMVDKNESSALQRGWRSRKDDPVQLVFRC